MKSMTLDENRLQEVRWLIGGRTKKAKKNFTNLQNLYPVQNSIKKKKKRRNVEIQMMSNLFNKIKRERNQIEPVDTTNQLKTISCLSPPPPKKIDLTATRQRIFYPWIKFKQIWRLKIKDKTTRNINTKMAKRYFFLSFLFFFFRQNGILFVIGKKEKWKRHYKNRVEEINKSGKSSSANGKGKKSI